MKNTNTLRIFFLVALCWLTYFATAQNPFELEHRMEENEIEVETDLNPGNPFEKAERTSPIAPINVNPNKTKPSISPPVERVTSDASSPFKFWVMIISLVLLTLLFVLYNSLVSKAYRGFLNENFLKMIHRNEGRIVSIPYLLLYALYFISGATFIYLVADHFEWYLFKEPVKQYFACLGGLLLVFLVKHITLLIISFVFPITKVVRQYSFTIVVFNIILGICLFPFNLFIAFTAPNLANGLIYLALGLILVFYIYRSIRGLLIAGSFMSFHKFHFFMYLCTVEIAPLVLLLGVLKGAGTTL